MPPRWTENAQCANCWAHPPKPLRCTACKSTYYCSVECQRSHWPKHKATCKAMVQQMQNAASIPTHLLSRKGEQLSAEGLIIQMKKWAKTHFQILDWASQQAMQVWLHPARIRTHVVYISLEYDCARPKSNQFTLKAITAGPTSDQTLSELNQPWFERSRRDTEELVAAGGLGVLRYMLHCSGTGLGQTCVLSADNMLGPHDNVVICTNYEPLLAKVLTGKLPGESVGGAWASLTYGGSPFPEHKDGTYMQVQINVEEDPPFALIQVRTREDDTPLLPREVRFELRKK